MNVQYDIQTSNAVYPWLALAYNPTFLDMYCDGLIAVSQHSSYMCSVKLILKIQCSLQMQCFILYTMSQYL